MSDTKTGSASGDTDHDCVQVWLQSAVDSRARLQLLMQDVNKQVVAEQSLLLVGQLGRGGQGSVWRALPYTDFLDLPTGSGDEVALKVARVHIPQVQSDDAQSHIKLSGKQSHGRSVGVSLLAALCCSTL